MAFSFWERCEFVRKWNSWNNFEETSSSKLFFNLFFVSESSQRKSLERHERVNSYSGWSFNFRCLKHKDIQRHLNLCYFFERYKEDDYISNILQSKWHSDFENGVSFNLFFVSESSQRKSLERHERVNSCSLCKIIIFQKNIPAGQEILNLWQR